MLFSVPRIRTAEATAFCNEFKRILKFHQSKRFLSDIHLIYLTFWRGNYFFNFSTLCIQNVNNTGTKQVRIMKQTPF